MILSPDIRSIHRDPPMGERLVVRAWVRTFRNDRFISLSDGSTASLLQAVVDHTQFDPELLRRVATGACLEVEGRLTESPASGQKFELQVDRLEVLGDSDAEKYPLQPKKHSLEFLREIAHLRPRTQTFGAVFRLRHRLASAVHRFFDERGFFWIHTPIITGSDAEGAGEMFRVTTLPPGHTAQTDEGHPDFSQDFFERETNLTVSGQLEAELFAMALSKVYTFGPTFRAENSNTARHLAEFWMIEPEVAFAELPELMGLAQEFVQYVLRDALEYCADELALLDQRQAEEDRQKPADQRAPMGLIEKLKFVVNNDFERVSYTEAIEILRQSPPNRKGKFQYPVEGWGVDLQSEHERYLVEKHFGKPVILYDYPANIKAFYMRLNEDGKTVRAMDVLFPGIGEIIGGSQREERLGVLSAKMEQFHIPEASLWWYLDTRKYGSCPHSGFGLGFERLVLFASGMSNIRDVIPFPRTPGNAEF
ncbi:asparagine--tRNA ligase [bacterium]|nr:asparagine--tRNA ligase [bacterium]